MRIERWVPGMAEAQMGVRKIEDPWLPRDLPRCTEKHEVWVSYQSFKVRQCLACDYVEPFYLHGVYPDRTRTPPSESEVRAARQASLATT